MMTTHHRLRRALCGATALLLIACNGSGGGASHPFEPDPPGPPGPSIDRVRLVPFILSINSQMPAASSNGYRPPTSAERTQFRRAVSKAMAGEVAAADSLLGSHEYGARLVIEEGTGDTLVVLQERNPIRRGWGTYIVNTSPRVAIDLHVNHPVNDMGSAELSAELFQRCRCRAMLVAGTNRYANPDEEADMARVTSSVFQEVYKEMAPSADVALSIHSFLSFMHPPPTGESHVVLSNGVTESGSRRATNNARALRDIIRQHGFTAGLFHDDEGYDRLSGSPNPQGRYANSTFGHGRWIHVEVATNTALSVADRGRLVSAIAAWAASGSVRSEPES